MITEFQVGGFKAFDGLQRVPIRPLTLVFGPNSGGKSSVIHALLLLHEACQRDSIDVTEPAIAGPSLDLGGFRRFSHRHRRGNRVQLGLTLAAESSGDATTVLLEFAFGLDRRARAAAAPGLIACEYRTGGVRAVRLEAGRNGKLWATDVNAENPGILLSLLGEKGMDFLAREYHEAEGLSASPEGFLNWAWFALSERLPSARQAIQQLEGRAVASSKARLRPEFRAGLTGLFPTRLFIPKSVAQAAELPVSEQERRYLLEEEQINSEPLPDELSFQRQINLQVARGQMWPHLPLTREVAPGVVAYLRSLVDHANRAVVAALADVVYLGPLRIYPPRGMRVVLREGYERALGEHSWQLAAGNASVRRALNHWLGDGSRMQTPYRVVAREYLPVTEARRVARDLVRRGGADARSMAAVHRAFSGRGSRGERLYEIRLADQRNHTEVSHRDVGLGVSQVLPVLVEAYASERKMIAIEQPEIHLHPGLQAELADVFMESALGQRKNTFLLETHSEHLILRVLRRLRETHEGRLPEGAPAVRPSDVAVLYVAPGSSGATVEELPVTEQGEFARPWPQGFFPDRARELFG